MSLLTAADIANIETGLKTAAGLNWSPLSTAFQKADYAGAAEIGLEDALTIASPWLPEAGTAKWVLHLAYGMVKQITAGHVATGSFRVEDLIQGIMAAEGVNWPGFLAALRSDNAIVAGADTAEVLAKLGAPFFPPAAIAGGAFGALAEIGKFTRPANPEMVKGYRWDSFRGWVRLAPGEAQPGPANPLAWLFGWLMG